MANITNEEHLAEVLSRFDSSPNPRLAEITRAAIRHLHAFVAEVKLTREEWQAGIQALTATGQMCTDKRQEFILLSDTLGVSMLVEMINCAPAEGTTEPTVFGPFHVDGAPRRAMGDSIVETPGPDDEPLVLRGCVRGMDGEPVAGAELDVWQASSGGLYDVQDPEQEPMNLRGACSPPAKTAPTSSERCGRWPIPFPPTARPVTCCSPTGATTGGPPMCIS